MWTIVVAGGTGARFGAAKQYELLDDRRVIDHARSVAEMASAGVVVVVPAADVEREGGVAGGSTRSDSVRAGLAEVPPEATIICVHDAARPLATFELYERVIAAVRAGADAAIPAVEVTDTIKVIDRTEDWWYRRRGGDLDTRPIDPGGGADAAGVPLVRAAGRARPGWLRDR